MGGPGNIMIYNPCGEEYKKRVYIAATVRTQNVLEERKLDTEEKLKAQKDLEDLSIASTE